MALRLRAEYVDGALKPLEPLELPEGAVVILHIEEEDQSREPTHSVVETADRVRRSAPAEIWDNLPADGAKNVKHYLYGHPKEDS